MLVILACDNPIRVKVGTHTAGVPVYAMSNPSFIDGDPTAGRRAFIDLRCIDCHRVAEDPHLPRGPSAAAGPVLGGLHRYAAAEVGKRIVSTSTGKDKEYMGRTMRDYTTSITARQLVDVVAYLRNPRLPRS